MSRLYMRARSDRGETVQATKAHRVMSLDLFYGSAKDNKRLGRIDIIYPKTTDTPAINVTAGVGVEVRILP